LQTPATLARYQVISLSLRISLHARINVLFLVTVYIPFSGIFVVMMPVTLLAISLLAAENITANCSRFVTRLLAVVKLLVFNTHTQYTHVHERTVYMPIGIHGVGLLVPMLAVP